MDPASIRKLIVGAVHERLGAQAGEEEPAGIPYEVEGKPTRYVAPVRIPRTGLITSFVPGYYVRELVDKAIDELKGLMASNGVVPRWVGVSEVVNESEIEGGKDGWVAHVKVVAMPEGVGDE